MSEDAPEYKVCGSMNCRPWNDADIDELLAHYPIEATPVLAKRLARSIKAVRSRAKLLGIHKRGRRWWTVLELEQLRARFPHERTDVIAASLHHSTSSVSGMAGKLGLHKSQEYLDSPQACRLRRGGDIGAAYRYPKGHEPANKGVKGWKAGGRSAETQFKPGQRGSKWVPIGSYRVTGDDHLEKKVSDTGYTPRDWSAVHRLVWISANGPIPDDSVVVFKPGRRTTNLIRITLDSLEMISRTELMRRNSIHNYPSEIKQTIRLIGKLKRTIERKAG